MRMVRLFCCALCFIQGIVVVVAVLFAGYFLEGPANDPVSADLIVVLGGASMSDRINKAAELYRKGYAERLLVTGFSENVSKVIPLIADWRVRYLEQLGVPRSAIIADSSARSSWMEAELVSRFLHERQWKTALIVSDPPHLRRLSWAFNKVFSGSSFDYRLISSEPKWWTPARWWNNSASMSFVMSEFIKLIYYRFEYD